LTSTGIGKFTAHGVLRNQAPAILVSVAVLVATLAALTVPPGLAVTQTAAAPIAFGFEGGTDGFFAPDWLAANGGQPFQGATRASEGSSALSLPVRMTSGGFDQAGADRVLDNKPVDLSDYRAIAVDVYAPVANLFGDVVFNDPWHPPVDVKPLQPGWNRLTFDITQGSAEFPRQPQRQPLATGGRRAARRPADGAVRQLGVAAAPAAGEVST
jgi:hypothetical protein